MIAAEALPRLHAALGIARTHVEAAQDSAVIVLGNEGYDVLETFISLDYWEGTDAQRRFERRAAHAGRLHLANRAVLIANMIEGDQEFLWIVNIDLSNGLDLARCYFERTDDAVHFGDVQVLESRAGLAHNCPGAVLLRAMLVYTPVSD